MSRFKIPIIGTTLVVLAAAAYHLLMWYDNQFNWGRMWETQAVRPHEEPILPMETDLVPMGGGEATYRAVGERMTSPLTDKGPKTVKAGETLYFKFCHHCHGKYHDGNGTVGQSFAPLPTDLRSPKVQKMAEGALFQNLSYGKPGGRQPPLATTVKPDDRWKIIAYILSLGIRP